MRCRMEIAIDMSAQVRQSRFISEYANLESVINEGMRLALQEPTPERTIQVILEYFGKSEAAAYLPPHDRHGRLPS